MSCWNRYPDYVSVAEKKDKAAKQLKQLQKKIPGIKKGCSRRQRRFPSTAVVRTGPRCANMWPLPSMALAPGSTKTPSLFFTLRDVRTDDLVAEAIQDKTAELLAKAERSSAKVFADADLSSLFGIELDTPPAFARENIKTTIKKSPAPKAAAQNLRKPGKKTPISRRPPSTRSLLSLPGIRPGWRLAPWLKKRGSPKQKFTL